MMFSLTILLYALVCNTIIGCLLQKSRKSKEERQEKNKVDVLFKIRKESSKKVLHIEGTMKESLDYENVACVFNMIAKWFFALSVVIFNSAFWTYSISQYINRK